MKRKFLSTISQPLFYLGTIYFLTFLIIYCYTKNFIFEEGHLFLYIFFWTGLFTIVFNISSSIINIIYLLIIPISILKEKTLKVDNLPSTAIVYVIKNETIGVFDKIHDTFKNNNLNNVVLWILSDSGDDCLEYEKELVNKLKIIFGEDKIFYKHRIIHKEKKQGNIKDWLIDNYKKYKYFLCCDADSILPEGVVLKLISKAEHPENKNIAIFQSRLEIVNAKTPFAQFQLLSAKVTQGINTAINQSIFGHVMSSGHNNLIRSDVFIKITVPEGAWSHDIWETAYLDRLGYRVAFCYDVISYEEAPSSYLEMRTRDKRWLIGTLQSWPLLFNKKISLATKFCCAQAIYMYISQPIFLVWLFLTFLTRSINFLNLQKFALIGTSTIGLEHISTTLVILFVFFLYSYFFRKKSATISPGLMKMIFLGLLLLNNIFYFALDILSLVIKKPKEWIPAVKNPYSRTPILKIIFYFWPSTLMGILGLSLGFKYFPYWALIVSPFLLGFLFVIPLTYITSIPQSHQN